MIQTTPGHVYDYPQYYDLIFGADWKDEFRFLEACFFRYAARKVRRVFEPACGTGRLLVKFAECGYQASGNDLNRRAIDYCNRRLRRRKLPETAFVADMADFTLRRPVDAAFNTINSFRHLMTQRQALAHLECMRQAVAPGGLYVLGLHILPPGERNCDEETWTARRGKLKVVSRMWTKQVDARKRVETVGMTYDVYRPGQRFRLEDEMQMRTYTARQMQQLLETAGGFELLETYDFHYDISEPLEVDETTEDVVYVLRRTE